VAVTMNTKSKRDPRRDPKPGDRIARVITNRTGMTGVYSRTVLALERHYRAGVTVVWTRKRPERPCRCSLTEWRRWAKGASQPQR